MCRAREKKGKIYKKINHTLQQKIHMADDRFKVIKTQYFLIKMLFPYL